MLPQVSTLSVLCHQWFWEWWPQPHALDWIAVKRPQANITRGQHIAAEPVHASWDRASIGRDGINPFVLYVCETPQSKLQLSNWQRELQPESSDALWASHKLASPSPTPISGSGIWTE